MSKRRTKVNPPKTGRYELKRRPNQDRFVILGQVQSARRLVTGRVATGVEGGRELEIRFHSELQKPRS